MIRYISVSLYTLMSIIESLEFVDVFTFTAYILQQSSVIINSDWYCLFIPIKIHPSCHFDFSYKLYNSQGVATSLSKGEPCIHVSQPVIKSG